MDMAQPSLTGRIVWPRIYTPFTIQCKLTLGGQANGHEVTKKKVQTTDFHGLHGLRIDYSHRGHRGHRVKLWGAPGGGPGGDLFFFFGFRMHRAGLSAER